MIFIIQVSGGKSGLDIYDNFWDDYKVFVLGNLSGFL